MGTAQSTQAGQSAQAGEARCVRVETQLSVRRKITYGALIAVFSLVVGSAGWWLNRARSESACYSCITALRMIDGAKQQWALEHHKTTNDIATWDDIRHYIAQGRL